MSKTQKPGPWRSLRAMQFAPPPLAFVFVLGLTVLLMVVLLLVDSQLQSPAAPKGIISFEFAGTVDRARDIVQSWEGRPAAFAGFSLGLDYLYMVAYATTIAWACMWASRTMGTRGWLFAGIGIYLAWGQVAAAGLDALENVALVVLLMVRVAAPWPQVAWTAAALKFALILAGLVYSLAGFAAWLAGRTKRAGVAG